MARIDQLFMKWMCACSRHHLTSLDARPRTLHLTLIVIQFKDNAAEYFLKIFFLKILLNESIFFLVNKWKEASETEQKIKTRA